MKFLSPTSKIINEHIYKLNRILECDNDIFLCLYIEVKHVIYKYNVLKYIFNVINVIPLRVPGSKLAQKWFLKIDDQI